MSQTAVSTMAAIFTHYWVTRNMVKVESRGITQKE